MPGSATATVHGGNGRVGGLACIPRMVRPCVSQHARYFPGYSRAIAEHRNRLTWAILKAHTLNRAGVVTLHSADPTEPPCVDFRYFDTADDPNHSDLRAVVAGIHMARRLAAPLRESGAIAEEEVPGPEFDTDGKLMQFVRDRAWGHHACGTCAIGTVETGGVLGSDFRVHGTAGLRVADASVFPRIPGYFIASAVYMIAEKAADMILADAMG
jgi:choline dehydrogenase